MPDGTVETGRDVLGGARDGNRLVRLDDRAIQMWFEQADHRVPTGDANLEVGRVQQVRRHIIGQMDRGDDERYPVVHASQDHRVQQVSLESQPARSIDVYT